VAAHKARPLYPATVADGHIHPLQVEWVRPGDLVTHARTGKLVQVVDERPHD
jgi:phenylacetate-CoA ligase